MAKTKVLLGPGLHSPTQCCWPNLNQVAETCQLALQKMQYLEEHPDATNEVSPYYSVDPTPALPASTPIAQLKETILDENAR